MDAKKNTPALAVTATMRDEAIAVDICHTILTLEFANGEILELDTAQLPANILSHAIAHGLKQKLVDAAAISRDPATGRAAGIDVKFHAVQEVYNRLLTGGWNKRREGGGSTGGLLFRALCIMYEGRKTADQLREFLADKSDKEKAALRKNPKVAKIIDDLRAEEGEDTEDLLAELDAEE